jgi:pimeloyl-ACP methyl ester carboxylesterase
VRSLSDGRQELDQQLGKECQAPYQPAMGQSRKAHTHRPNRGGIVWLLTQMFQSLLRKLFAILLLFASASTSDATEKWQSCPPPPPLPFADQSGKASVNGISMYYAIYGKGRGSPILLIHGGMGSADVWGFEVPKLSRTHEVIVADSRGHGRSSHTDAAYSYHLMAEDYVALLDWLNVPKVALVGWSDGGIIGLDIAMNHSERLTKLFAQAANATPAGLNPNPDLSGLSAACQRDEAEYKRLSPTPGDFAAFKAAIEAMWETEPNYSADDLRKITVPTEIVVGDHDEFILPQHSRYLAETIPDARLVILKNVSHMAIYQDPDQYIDAIQAFIDGGKPVGAQTDIRR